MKGEAEEFVRSYNVKKIQGAVTGQECGLPLKPGKKQWKVLQS